MTSHSSGDADHPRPQPHSHGHSHGHGHGFEGGWRTWGRHPTLRAVLVAVVLAGLATVAGIAVLWPSGEGRRIAIENAEGLGLVTDRLSATVEGVVDASCSYATEETPQDCRTFTFQVNEGPEAGAAVTLPEMNVTFDRSVPDLAIGDDVILGYEDSTNFYFYADRDRRGALVALTVVFALVVIALGRFRGLLALSAMAATIAILVWFVAPSVLDGNDPIVVAVVAASAIAFISLYLTHGFSPTTTVALAGTLAALGLTLALATLFFDLAEFTGLATEEGLILPFVAGELNMSSLLLGGAIIGALGALDDVTVTQVATVAELRHRSPELSTAELVTSGIRVGREHIASTVNTLLLAYAGASMPLLLLFAISDQPLQMVANSELVAVEIVRTLCGSVGLVAAVPITTMLAALVVSGRPPAGTLEPDHAPADDPAAGEAAPATTAATPVDAAVGATPVTPTETDSSEPAAADEPRATDDDLDRDRSDPEAFVAEDESPTAAGAIAPDASAATASAGEDDWELPERRPSWDDFAPRDDLER